MILAGDIGGTHTRIAFFEESAGKLNMALERVYPSRDHKGLDEILSLFLGNGHANIDRVCFGVAGPVIHDQVSTPNLPWIVEALKLAHQLGVPQVSLINDLMAHASGLDDLAEEDFIRLNKLDRQAGNAALIAAGTGLGEAGIYWDGVRRWPFPCEGGHSDFAPRNDLEIALLEHLLKKFDHVSCERVVSGQGFLNIYDFLRHSGKAEEPSWLKQELESAADPAVVISQYGVQGKAGICELALDLFVSVYGAEAGNLALKIMATGGMFVSGGIAAKILPKITNGAFLQAFVSKGRLQPLLETIPVKVIVNERVGLIGAARYAVQHADKRN